MLHIPPARLVMLLMSFASPALAAQAPGSRQTREFVQAAAQSDEFEIVASRTSLTQSHDQSIRSFAGRMIRDHEETSRSLAAAAARDRLSPPPRSVGEDHARMLGALQSLVGREFDKTYAQQQILAHRSAFITEQLYSSGGDAPAIRQAATVATKLMASHLSMADTLADKFREP
jgi:putative membrane protein